MDRVDTCSPPAELEIDMTTDQVLATTFASGSFAGSVMLALVGTPALCGHRVGSVTRELCGSFAVLSVGLGLCAVAAVPAVFPSLLGSTSVAALAGALGGGSLSRLPTAKAKALP